MPLPVTVYRWDDVGAPSIGTKTATDILNIFKKCLVEGYGAKSPLGWTIPFEDAPNNKVVFRNSTTEGSGGFVQFWDYIGTNPASSTIAFQGAVSMTGLDAFEKPQARMLAKAASLMNYWVLIGTSCGFWFITHNSLTTPYGATYDKMIFFVGDFNAFVTNDVGRFVNLMYSTTTDMTSTSWNYSFDSSMQAGSPLCRIYDTDSSDNYLAYKMDGNYLTGSNNHAGIPTVARIFNKPLMIGTVSHTSTDRLGVISSVSVIRPYYRGEIPGLLNSPQGGYSGEPWPTIETINGEQHLLMAGYQFGRTWINLESWYD